MDEIFYDTKNIFHDKFQKFHDTKISIYDMIQIFHDIL